MILLLHGFPTTSHVFRDLIPHLAHRCRVMAPDLPGFGLTKAPPRGQFGTPSPASPPSRAALAPEAIRTQYVTGADPSLVSPDDHTLDVAHVAREGTDEVQIDPIHDRRANVAPYGRRGPTSGSASHRGS